MSKTSKVVVLELKSFIDKDIFVIGFIDNNYCKYLFYYLKLDKDSRQ